MLSLDSVSDLEPYLSDPDDEDALRDEMYVFEALENHPEIEDRIRAQGYTWVKFPDPLSSHVDAETHSYIGTEPLPPARLVERIEGTYHPNNPTLDAQLKEGSTKDGGLVREPDLVAAPKDNKKARVLRALESDYAFSVEQYERQGLDRTELDREYTDDRNVLDAIDDDDDFWVLNRTNRNARNLAYLARKRKPNEDEDRLQPLKGRYAKIAENIRPPQKKASPRRNRKPNHGIKKGRLGGVPSIKISNR